MTDCITQVKIIKEDKRSFDKFVELLKDVAPFFSIASVLVAIYGANIATKSARIATQAADNTQKNAEQMKERAALTERLHLRQQSYITYVSSSNSFYADLISIRNAIPVDIEEPSAVRRASKADLDALREAVSPIVRSRQAFNAAFFTASVVWPKAIRDEMSESSKVIDPIAVCYEQAAIRIIGDTEIQDPKNGLINKCVHLKKAEDDWYASYTNIKSDMATSIHGDQGNLGLDPEGL